MSALLITISTKVKQTKPVRRRRRWSFLHIGQGNGPQNLFHGFVGSFRGTISLRMMAWGLNSHDITHGFPEHARELGIHFG